MALRHRPLPAALRAPTRHRLVAALGLALAGWSSMASAQTWNAGTGSWLDAVNWTPLQVPLAGGTVAVSNGGTAQLTGIASTPQLGSLSIGLASSGTGQGSVTSNGVTVRTNALNVGVSFNTGSFAQGLLDITGADAQTGQVNIGWVFGAPVATSASGTVQIEQALALNNAPLQVGQIINSAGGSSATGTLQVGGNGGTASAFFYVGSVGGFAETQLGNTATGTVTIGGNFALAGGTNSLIGTTFGTDRDATGTLFNRATGSVTVGGTLSMVGSQALAIGQTSGGVAAGALTVGALDMASGQLNGLSVGTSSQGNARGSLVAGAGDLRLTGTANIGTTGAGTAEGTVQLGSGGQLLSSGGGGLRVGVANATNDALARATGLVDATGGVAGFSGFEVGVLSGKVAAGSFADGTLLGGGSAPATTTGTVNVGSLLNFSGQEAGAGSARGRVEMGNTLAINGGFLQVGQMFLAGGGSTATGSVTIGGNGGQVGGFFIVGNVSASSEAQLGSVSTGSVDIGGNLALLSSTSSFIGTTVGTDRDTAGTQLNRATGSVTVGGTLTLGDSQTMAIGQTSGGVANGALTASTVQMALGRLASLNIGNSGLGSATGSVDVGGGTLGVQNLQIGNTGGGSAYGRLALNQATLEAGRLRGGTGGGVAEVLLSDSSARIDDGFELFNGLLSLDGSLLAIGDRLALGAGTELRIDIDGQTRGIEFGAIDALSAELDGLLAVDFTDLLLGGPMVFDLLRSGSGDGIAGNFSSFSFTGLQAGYSVWHGIELDGVEVYRLRIARNDVPEPASGALVLLALGVMTLRARRKAGAAPLRSPAPG